MRNLRHPPSAPFLSGRARRYLLHLLRHRTRSHGGLSARLRVPPGGAQARKGAGARRSAEFPNRDIQVTEKLLRDTSRCSLSSPRRSSRRAHAEPGVVDLDVREALDGLIRTYRTLQSGVYYESRPDNPLAGGDLTPRCRRRSQEYRERASSEELGMTKTRDADVLGLLVFLQRFELYQDNGRPRGRAFLDALRAFHPPAPEPPASSPSADSAAESASDAPVPPGRRAFLPVLTTWPVNLCEPLTSQLDRPVHRKIEGQQVAFAQRQQVADGERGPFHARLEP